MNVTLSVVCPRCQSANVQKRGIRGQEQLKQRLLCTDCNHWFTCDVEFPEDQSWVRPSSEIRELVRSHDTFIVTCAQNNTSIYKPFWESIKVCAEKYKAAIIVIPIWYYHPDLPVWNDQEIWWPEEITPYLIQNDIQIARSLYVMGEVRLRATAVNPLSGLETLSKGESAVFGHPQVQMRTIAAPQHSLPKIIHTTGSVSVKNYSRTKAGAKGAFHHTQGAIIIERDGNNFHLRSVIANQTGSFYDLNYYFTPAGVKKNRRVEALVTGDSHVLFHDPDVMKATFTDSRSIVNALRPKYIVRHDVLDSYSISHHHRNQPMLQFKKWRRGENVLQRELTQVVEFLKNTTPPKTTNVIVASNHHEHIARWLQETDPRQEPWNAILFHELSLDWLRAIEAGEEDYDPFIGWMRKHNPLSRTIYLKRHEPFIIKDVLVSMHGDKGVNGTRGSIRAMGRIGLRSIIGHSHTPAIEKGSYMVGTSSKLVLEYNRGGPSSWLHTHAIIHPDGKRQLINIINGRWRLPRE